MSDRASSRLERLLRLAELNRGPLSAEHEASRIAMELRRRRSVGDAAGAHPQPSEQLSGGSPVRRDDGPGAPMCRPSCRLDATEPLRGSVVDHPRHGTAFAVSMCDDVPSSLVASETDRLEAIRRLMQCACRGPEGVPEEELSGGAALLDIETGGLGDSVVFLVGVLRLTRNSASLTQYLARDYSEEAAVIALTISLLADTRLLVTFNGKSFDMPMLRARAARYRIAMTEPEVHVDLLHVCRKAWHGELPNFRLQTLESRVCGRWRADDIPGCEVPDVYHAYVRTGSTDDMARVLRHNADDLATLAELALRLPG